MLRSLCRGLGPALLACSVGLVLSTLPGATRAQAQPYRIFDTRPVITEGPYLVAMSDSAVSVVWMTDAPSHAKVRLSDGTRVREIEPQVDGLVPVGLRHVVTLTGLAPGARYSYEAVATRVVKLKPYWPDKGLSTSSPAAAFTTFSASQPRASFSVVTDTHEDRARIERLLKLVDWAGTDALIHLGDAFDWVDSEEQVFGRRLRPTIAAMGPGRPLLFARGNHELRGAFARQPAATTNCVAPSRASSPAMCRRPRAATTTRGPSGRCSCSCSTPPRTSPTTPMSMRS